MNDTLGHVTGDDILKAFGELLIEENRTMNLVGRYGGDEFVSVLSDSGLDGARQYIARVQSALTRSPVLTPHSVSVSMGVAEFDDDEMRSVDDLLRAADMDMYRVKAARRSAQKAASG